MYSEYCPLNGVYVWRSCFGIDVRVIVDAEYAVFVAALCTRVFRGGPEACKRRRNVRDVSVKAPAKCYPHDISAMSELTKLYNKRVIEASHVERPLAGVQRKLGPLKHSGVVVTTEDGERWLIHKGGDYGISTNTVVTSARHMSRLWTVVLTHRVTRGRVADYVKVGGEHYAVLTDNCHCARRRMMDIE